MPTLDLHGDMEHMDAVTIHALCDHIEILHERLVRLEGFFQNAKNGLVTAAKTVKKGFSDAVVSFRGKTSTEIINKIKEKLKDFDAPQKNLTITYTRPGQAENGIVDIFIANDKNTVKITTTPSHAGLYNFDTSPEVGKGVNLTLPDLAKKVSDLIKGLPETYFNKSMGGYMDISPYAHTILQCQFKQNVY